MSLPRCDAAPSRIPNLSEISTGLASRKRSPNFQTGEFELTKIAQFAREELGLELYAGQVGVLEDFEGGGFQQAVWQCGRRSGKSLMADVLALYDAVARDHLRSKLRPGELRVCGIISPRLEQSNAHVRNISKLIESNERLSKLVVRMTSEEIEFANGSIIQSFPCSARGIRGGAWSSAVLDEFGHFLSAEDGNATGDVVYQAVRPSLTQFGKAGWLITISTPMWRQGMFWKLVDRAKSGRFPYIHYVKRSTAEMNPTPEVKEEADKVRREDPDLYAREYLAEFVDGISSYLNSADVVACKRPEGALAPRSEVNYTAAIDPAYTHDAFAMAIGHKEGGRVVIDGIWSWRRQGHEYTMEQVAQLAKLYRVEQVRTDQHAAVPVRESLEKRGLLASYQPWTNESKMEAFSRLKIGFNTRNVEIPDDELLVEELCSLEARPTQGGFTRIQASGGGHDDRAVCVASVVQALDRPDELAIIFAGDDRDTGKGDELDNWTRRLSGSNSIG